MVSRALTFLLLLAALVGAPAAEAQEPEYAIRSGDRITTRLFSAAGEEIRVVGGQRIVDRNGEVFLPFVGSLRVSGLEESSLRALLTERYSAYYDQPVVDVQVELRINVTGAVGRPNQYFMDPTANITDAVAEAGGIGPEFAVASNQIPADPEQVRLVRDGEVTILNLRAADISTDVLNMRIQSGDWIHVPYRQRSRVRDEVQFWGSVVSFAASIVGLVVLIGR